MKDLIFVALVLGLAGCSWINEKIGLSDDNPAEEIAEAIIEQKTGLDIDLTPDSPESD